MGCQALASLISCGGAKYQREVKVARVDSAAGPGLRRTCCTGSKVARKTLASIHDHGLRLVWNAEPDDVTGVKYL